MNEITDRMSPDEAEYFMRWMDRLMDRPALFWTLLVAACGLWGRYGAALVSRWL